MECASDQQDMDYILLEENLAIRTKLQATVTLGKKDFGTFGRSNTLPGYGRNTLNVGNKKRCVQDPKKGVIVLVEEATVPRHA